MARQRDYKAEYARRIARGRARGYTRSQARGHPKAGEANVATRVKPVTYDPLLEQGLKSMRKGTSLSASARMMGISPERLRRYLSRAGVIEKQGRRWIPSNDTRPREIAFFSDGQIATAMVADYPTASLVGSYMADVKQFLLTNDIAYLEAYEGQSFADTSGTIHVLETRPNELYRLNEADSEPFEQVYRVVM